MRSFRIACLLVPLFPLAARLRSEPELAAEPLAIVEGNGSTARITAAARPARNAGVRPELTLAQARSICPKLIARPRDPACEQAAQEALVEVSESFSPRVEDALPGMVYLDLSGLERRGGSDEPELGRQIIRAAERVALPVRVGIASSKLAARIAAGLVDSPVVVPHGEEAAFLAPLPLASLSPELDIAATLERWGIRSIGEFAALPKTRVASRLGSNGQSLHAMARGLDPDPLVPRPSPLSFHEGMALEWPLVALEPFLFVGRAALERLCARLESCGLACSKIELSLRLEPDGHQLRSIALPAPTLDIKTLLTLVRLELEARPPGAPVIAFTLIAHPDRAREAQLSLYGPSAPSPDRLAATLARLFALLGPGRVGSPALVNGHLPERFALVAYSPPPPPPVLRPPPPGRGLLAVRILRPAIELEVIAAETGPGQSGAPLSVQPVVQDSAVQRLRIQGTVKIASGPWGLEERWWSEKRVGRDYWDVEIVGGGLFRLYRDRADGQWYADGVYD
jgi:protein ImuB